MLNDYHPMLVNADSIRDDVSINVVVYAAHPETGEVNYWERWVRARHLGMPNLFLRVKLAWGVFTGKYDALEWTGQ